jgi:hypothetical protein
MKTILHRLTLTFRSDGAVDAVIVRKGPARRRHEIYAFFDEGNWFQWGEPVDILAENSCLIERIREVLIADYLSARPLH